MSYDEGRALVNRYDSYEGETVSHYQHLEFERSYDEGRALVNSYDSYESFNWWNCISLSTLRIWAQLWWREGLCQLVRLVRVVQLVNLHLIKSSRTTHTSRQLVNLHLIIDTYNRIWAQLWWREGLSQLVWLVRVVQLVKLHLIIDTWNLSAVMIKGGPSWTCTTRTSRSTGETVSHYWHLEF